MRKIFALITALLLTLSVLTFPALAGEATTEEIMETVTEVVTEAPTEEATEPVTEAVIETVTEAVTEPETEAVTVAVTEAVTESVSETEAETETAVPVDEWIYNVMQQATPEQVELIEGIVLGGLDALDKLDIQGFDRIRVWVEYNMATVMVIALIVGLVAFCVVNVIQKKAFAKKAEIMTNNAIEMYEAGQTAAVEAQVAAQTYADRSDKICQQCAEAAKEAAQTAKEAQDEVMAERAILIAEIDKNAKVNAALCETVNFLMQCSDLSQSKRDEAEAIFRKGMEAMSHDEANEA